MLSYGLGALGLKSEYSIVERTERLGLSFAVITFIPSVSIVVSLIGTFAFMQFMGFSLNLLTLFALVLAIGTVVDDAIIVVEAVQANFDKGYPHHAPWHVAPDGGYGSRSQWQPLISLLCGGWHGVGYPCPVLPRARPVHHLPVVARTADAKENGGVIEVNYSK